MMPKVHDVLLRQLLLLEEVNKGLKDTEPERIKDNVLAMVEIAKVLTFE